MYSPARLKQLLHLWVRCSDNLAPRAVPVGGSEAHSESWQRRQQWRLGELSGRSGERIQVGGPCKLGDSTATSLVSVSVVVEQYLLGSLHVLQAQAFGAYYHHYVSAKLQAACHVERIDLKAQRQATKERLARLQTTGQPTHGQERVSVQAHDLAVVARKPADV